jgi:hypothetical protein
LFFLSFNLYLWGVLESRMRLRQPRFVVVVLSTLTDHRIVAGYASSASLATSPPQKAQPTAEAAAIGGATVAMAAAVTAQESLSSKKKKQ